jgi:ribosome recycling factor
MDNQVQAEVKIKMQKAMHVVQEDLGTIRSGRATPALVENVSVTTYGGTTTLKLREIANITTEGPRMLIITPYDQTTTHDIEKAIGSANLGYTAAVDGNIMRISIPPLTADRREEFIKLAHQKLEGGRVMLRQIRHEAMNDIKRAVDEKQISEDDKKRLEKEIQAVTDEMMSEIELLREKKETELREI